MKTCTTLAIRHASDHRCYPVSAGGATERLCKLAEDQLLNYDTTTKNDFECWLLVCADAVTTGCTAGYSACRTPECFIFEFIRVEPTAYGY